MNNEMDVVFGKGRLRVEDIAAIAEGRSTARLTADPAVRARITAGADFLVDLLRDDGVIYGVTTGYGDSCTTSIPPHLVEELPLHLTRFHGCGLGDAFSIEQGRAILATRLTSLSQGFSGVRWELLQQLEIFLQRDVVPIIPQEGSVGASGDLTPLSYVAAALIGERDVYFEGDTRSAADVLRALDIAPLTLRPKEALALMNGTAVMTALACLAHVRAQYLTRLATRITAFASLALHGNPTHYDEKLFSVKPHPGQGEVAGWLRADLGAAATAAARNSSRLQDRYSLRCAPHIIGVLADALPFMRTFIENELNSANDNPIIDPDERRVLHGGHFYGGHIAFAMDALKTAVANIADLLDRQMALLMDVKFNAGLPPNLSGAAPERAMINHGFKAVQIGTSAWTAEALKLCMPASVFSRSTECHNQDKVSMGTIAARDCLRVLQLTEQVAAAALLAAAQGVELRCRNNDLAAAELAPGVQTMLRQIFAEFEFVEEDRPLEANLRQFVNFIQTRHWSIYE